MKTLLKYLLMLIVVIFGFIAFTDVARKEVDVSEGMASEQLAFAASGGKEIDASGSHSGNEPASVASGLVTSDEEDESLRVISSILDSSHAVASKKTVDDLKTNDGNEQEIEEIDARQILLDTLSMLDANEYESTEVNPSHPEGNDKSKSNTLSVATTKQIVDKADFENSGSGENQDCLAKQLGVRMRPGRDSVTIGAVSRSGAAYLSGLRPGDTVISVDREPVLDTGEFKTAISELAAGESVQLFIVRGEDWRSFSVTVPTE